MAEKTGLDPRCFTPASTFSGAIERIKSKVILTCPRDIEIVDLVESLFSGGYSSVHTRLGFDTEMFTPESTEYIKERDEIIDQVRNLCGEKNEKKDKRKLDQKLYDIFKQENLKSCNRPICSLPLDGEEESKKRRVFSKIFKLNENNQYGFAMTKRLPISIFKKEPHVDMDTLNRSVENFDPNAGFGEIFVVDIEFGAYNDPRKKMYNKVFPCVFEPKNKVSVKRRSVYQLLSTMRTREITC